MQVLRTLALISLVALVTMFVPSTSLVQAELLEPELVLNPYDGIDWIEFGQHKANLHTHTVRGGGSIEPNRVVRAYHERGYSVLALTDHDNRGQRSTTWPWSGYGVNARELGMIAVEGNELSWQHHIGSYYNDYGGRPWGSVNHSLREIGRRGGLAVFFHPGRYNQPEGWSWYKPYFEAHNHLLGIEVFNQGDRYPQDRALWDNLLSSLMPKRPVWGFSNDDMHREAELGRNWNTLLLRELSDDEVREALVQGRFYMTYQPGSHSAPTIREVIVTERSITIKASDYAEIRWVSHGRVIHRGEVFDYTNAPRLGVYVRAEIEGTGGLTLTNPFGFICLSEGIACKDR